MALSAKELQSFSSRITKSISPSTASNPRVTQLREQTNQVLSQGPQMVQQPKTVVNAPIKVAQPNIVQSNASWVGGQVNQNVVQPLVNTVKKIGSNLTAKLVAPQSTMLKDAGIDTAKVETLKLKPNQKKLAPEQLQKVAGASSAMKPQSKEESIKKARQIQAFTATKIQDLEKAFQAKKVEPKKLPKGYKEPGILGDMVDALKEGVVSTMGSIGAGFEMTGRQTVANPTRLDSIATKFLTTNIGKRISDEADNILASNPEWAADPEAKLLLKNGLPNPKTVARLGVGAAPSILINIAATLVTAPVGGWGGLVTGYMMEGGSTYKEAKKMGVPEEKAQFYGTTVGIVNSILEHLMPTSSAGLGLFKKGAKEVGKESVEEISKSVAKEALKQAKKFGINILKNGAIEGSTEGVQEFWSNVIATNYDKNRKPWDNVIESMVGGFVGGGVAGGSTESAIDNNSIVIPEGEHTPQAVIGQVIANGQENTVEGKELIKTAVEAQQSGQNVLIETTPKFGEMNDEEALMNESRKYKSAEEFVERDTTKMNDGDVWTNPKNTRQVVKTKEGADATRSEFEDQLFKARDAIAEQGGKQNASTQQIIAEVDAIRGIKAIDGVYDSLPTKSQLTDIWNQANNKKGPKFGEDPTKKQGEVNSEVTTINQEETKVETKVEKPKVEYTAGAIKKIQTQMDEILGVDPNMKNFKMKQKLWGESFMITDQAANAGDKDAIADIEKLVALQIQLEDMRDARQAYLKNKKTKKSAKDYVEGKVKERSVKFRETKEVKQIRKLQGDELLLAIENNIEKVADISKNKLQAVDDFVELEDISKKLLKGKEKPADITTAYEILQRNGIDIGQQAGQTANEYVAQKGPKFREDTSKPLTLEEIKAQNAAAKQESAKTGQENAEDTAEKVMGWKTGDQKREFDAAMNKKDAAKVREMLPNVPEYFKTEFKQEIDEVLNNDFTEEAKILRGTKGLTADDIMKTYPNIQLKKDVPATDIYGNKKIIPEGEKLTPYELKGNKILLQDGETYIVTKNQFQNIKGQSKMAEGKPFAPELEGLDETVMGKGAKYAITSKVDRGEISWEEAKLLISKTTKSDTKYSQYTLPGGENYREILIKAPRNLSDAKDITAPDGRIIKGIPSGRQDFKSSHWDDLNVIAHLRMNDRTYNGEKVAFMEELQSDWAREARQKGFNRDKITTLPDNAVIEEGNSYKLWKVKIGETSIGQGTTKEIATADAIKALNVGGTTGVPNNPLLKNWQELTIKRALKDAVNSDAEYFAWINGDQTSNRYNLATHVEDVVWYFASGYKTIKLQPKETADRIEFGVDAEGVIRQVEEARYVDWKGKKLDEVLGKGLADKIMADEKGTLSGEGLRFGGEWANTLYDKQVKNIVEDLTGGKVETIDMGLSSDEKVKRFLYNGSQGTDIMAGDRVTADTIKVGQVIYEAGKSTNHIITEVLGKGKFKAISTSELFDMSGDEKAQYISDLSNPGQYEKRLLEKNGEDSRDWINKQLENRKRFLNENSETFDISQKTTQQQALKLTPEIKARIKGEALQIETSGKMFEEAKFRVKDDVKRMTGRVITDAQEQELIDLNKKIFGDENVNITLQIMANSKALGKYEQNMIDILDGQADPKATYLHEAVHKYLDVFSTSDEYTQVLEEGAVKYKIEDFAEVEERIAEDFIAYAKNKDAAPKTISGKIRSFFDSMLERIKIYFGNKSAIDRLYNDIVEGKAAKKATKTAQETTPGQKTDIPTNQIAQTPVGEGDKTKSKAYTRVIERLSEEAQQDVSYNKLNLDKDADNALEFITTDPKAALRVGLGLEEAPAGMTDSATSIALADKAFRDGDDFLSSWLESSRSRRQTRRGQEIVSERGRFNEDSPHFFIRELMDMRLKNLGSSLKSSLEELQGKAKSVKKAAIEKIDKGVSKLKEKIKSDRKKITLAQDIIDSIIC